MEDKDAQLQLKKRARRRLVGAFAFAGLAAVVLPMVMDHEPKQASQDVEIRIPGQDEKPFAPKFATAPTPSPAVKPTAVPVPTPIPVLPEVKPSPKPSPGPVKPVESAPAKAQTPEKAPEKPMAKPVDKPAAKPERLPEKTPEKPAEKAPEKVSKAEDQRAAAILSGKSPEGDGQFVILIGAFSNQANVKILQTKLGELGIKMYTEPLDSPQGRKTRVRAGPFPSRDAGEKALDKMKRLGISGVLAAKQ